jgi:hypothetical protein
VSGEVGTNPGAVGRAREALRACEWFAREEWRGRQRSCDILVIEAGRVRLEPCLWPSSFLDGRDPDVARVVEAVRTMRRRHPGAVPVVYDDVDEMAAVAWEPPEDGVVPPLDAEDEDEKGGGS